MQITTAGHCSKSVFDKIAQTIVEKPGMSSVQIAKKINLSVSYIRSALPHVCKFHNIVRKKKGSIYFYFPAKSSNENQLLVFPSSIKKTSSDDNPASLEIAKMLKEIGTKEAIEAMKDIAIALGGQG